MKIHWRRWGKALEPFWQACGWTVALFIGYFAGLVGGPASGVVAFGMCLFAIAALIGSFLAGLALGQNIRGGFIRELRRLRQERRPHHTRTPACVVGRGAPCRDALCDCGHHCGRHGLVVGGSAAIKPPGCDKPNLLDRCSLCDCSGWRQS